jgi:hypothetical protein
MELGPTVISNTGLITRVDFAAIPKFYTDSTSNLQKLIHYWLPIPILRSNFTISQWSLQSSLQNREIPSHPLSTPQLPLLPTHGWSSRTKADTPHCSAISTSYCRRPRPASYIASRCHQRRHCHCPYRARWHMDRSPHHAHPQRRAGDHCWKDLDVA